MILRQPLKSAKLSIRARNSYALALVWPPDILTLGFRRSEQKANYFSIVADLGSKHLTLFPGGRKGPSVSRVDHRVPVLEERFLFLPSSAATALPRVCIRPLP